MSDNIVVAVRVRPLIAREEGDFSSIHWQISDECTITQADPRTRKPLYNPYKFDRVFSTDYSNGQVYVEVAEPIVEAALCGFNGTIFAYGQTSSGKTFTMMGDKNNPGIIPLSIQNIFSSIENTPNREYLIRASYMEIYNENITDLLADRSSRGKSLSIREDISGAVYVADLKEECVNCEESLYALMKKGDKNRHVGVTNMNERSSRSHTIFRLILESRERNEGDGEEGAVTVSHLNLVDLAGSENASQSGATGERLKEGGFINKSLFMLGRVISQLSDGEQFINFRDSKLTRILQLSLGGNAKTAIFCTVTPAAIEQTHSTLRFASRAKSIKNKPVVNEVLSDNALLKRYAKEIKNLKSSLEKERNTDKAQEVEQVREMLDEQARRNQELEAKVNELKTKLVVSSLPLNYSKDCNKKKRKCRRETWAAPPMIRAMRASLGPVRIEPLKLEHDFLRSRLTELTEVPEIQSTDVASSATECSFLSEGFGREETSLCLDMAEQSKLGKFDASFTSPLPVNVMRRRKVHFEVTSLPSTDSCDAECQTEETLLPKVNFLGSSYRTTPKRGSPESHTPGTPAHILKARNLELRQKLDEQDVWLIDWQKEMNDLREYQKTEINLLQESFDAKVVDGSFDINKLENQRKDILSLKHSLQDAESLLLDANRELSQKSQDMATLQEQLERVNAENLRCSSFEADFIKLCEEQKGLKKGLEDKEIEVTQLQNDRQDFDMMMELALKKQKQLEKDLRRSLDDAWEEIAAYKGGNKEAVGRSSQHISLLAEELSPLHTNKEEGQGAEQIINDLKQQLEEAHVKEQAHQQEIEEQKLKLQQMKALLEKMTKVESQNSCMETLESKLSKAQDEVRSLRTDNIHLRNTTNELQAQLDNKELEGGVFEIQPLQEECLRKKYEETDGEEIFSAPLLLHCNTTKGDTTMTSMEISRKLSETLHALEESVFLPSTPGRRSVSSLDEPYLQTQDLEIIKQQLLGLQEALLAQDQYQQLQQQKLDTLKAETTHERLYHSQVVAALEEELATWKVQESFCGDFIINSWNSHKLNKRKSGTLCPLQAAALSKSGIDIASDEGHTESGPESWFKNKNSVLKTGFCYETYSKVDVHCTPLEQCNEFQSPANELHQADMDMTCCSKASEVSVSNHESHSPSEEIKQIKWQLEQLKKENALLTDQIKQFKEISQRSERVDSLKEQLAYTSEEEELFNLQNMNQEIESVYATPQQSLADELREAGMNTEFCNETFETSVLYHVPNSSSQRVQQLEQQFEQLNQENLFYDKQLKTSLDQVKENIFTELGETGEKLNQNISEKSKNMIKNLEMELQLVVAERNTLDIEMGKLKEKLSDKVIMEEELCSYRWQVESLKQEKSDLKEEFELVQEYYEKMLEKSGASVAENVHIKEGLERETGQLSLKEDSLLTTENTSSSRYSEDIIPKNSTAATEELENAKKKNYSLERELDRLKNKLNNLGEKNVLEAGKEKSSLEKENMKYIEMNKVLEETLEELKEKLKNKTKELDEVIAEKDSELEIMITNFSEKEEIFENKEKEMKQLAMKIGEIRKKLDDKEVELQKLRIEHTDLQAVVNDLQSNLIQRSEEYSLLDEKHSKVQDELTLLKADFEKKIHELTRNGISCEEQSNKQTLDVGALNRFCEEKKIVIDAEEMNKQIKDNLEKDTNEAVHISRTTISSSVFESLDSLIIDQKLDELEHLKNEYASKVKECEQLREVSDNLKIILNTREEKLKEMSSEHSIEISSFIESLSKKEELINNLEDEVKDRKEKVVCMRSTVEAKDIKIKRLENDLQEAQQALDDKEREFQESIACSEAEASSMAQDFQREKERIINLYEEVCTDRKNMALVIKTHEEQTKRLTSDCNSLNLKLENLEKNYRCISETLEVKQAEIVQKKEELSLLESEYQKRIEDIDLLQSKKMEWIIQQESSSYEMEKLVGIVEKYETEMSEKDEQMHKLRLEAENNITIFSKKLEEMTQKYGEAEEKVMRYVTIEEEFIKHGIDLSELQILLEKLATVEGKLVAVQDELHDKVNEHSEEIVGHIHEKQELSDKLLHTEEHYRNVKEKLDIVYSQLQEKTTEFEALNIKLKKVESELSDAKLRFMESERDRASSSLLISDKTQRNKIEVVQLEQTNKKFKERINDLEQCRRTLQEELKVSSDTVDSLLERLGDHDKLQLVYQKEKEALEKKIDVYQNRIETFRQSTGDEKAALEKIDDLMQNVTHLKSELQISRKKFEDLVKEHSMLKKEYSSLFKEFEEIKAHNAEGELLPQEQKMVHEKKFVEVNTLPSMLMDGSVADISQNITGRKGRSKIFTHEEVMKGESIKSELEFSRQSQSRVSTVEEHHCELGQMKTDVTAGEHELDCFTHDSMERKFTALGEEGDILQDRRKQGNAISETEKLAELQRRYKELQEEISILRKAPDTKTTDTSLTGEDSSRLQERLIVAERENDELRLKLRALSAPAEKQVLTLRKELNLANQKVSHLNNELRRVQNSKCMDTTISEFKGSGDAQSNAESGFDYSSRSGIILEVQVLGMENEIYHLNKEKKLIERECMTLKEHVEHYKNKALEWRKSAFKEKKLGEKVKEELELLQTKNNQYKTKVGESRSHIERQQFELGHQREVIEKLEKERQEQLQKCRPENSAAFMESHRRQAPSHTKETESIVGNGTGNNNVGKTRSCSNLQQLGVHNTPFPAPTRTERLPCVNTSVEIQKNSAGKPPLWQSLNKRDYSKYYPPPGADKENEDCKTQ